MGSNTMPLWTVQLTDGEDEEVEAGLLATEGGALVALSDDGLMVRAWAPGRWQTVRQVTGADAHPAGRDRGKAGHRQGRDAILIDLPRG